MFDCQLLIVYAHTLDGGKKFIHGPMKVYILGNGWMDLELDAYKEGTVVRMQIMTSYAET